MKKAQTCEKFKNLKLTTMIPSFSATQQKKKPKLILPAINNTSSTFGARTRVLKTIWRRSWHINFYGSAAKRNSQYPRHLSEGIDGCFMRRLPRKHNSKTLGVEFRIHRKQILSADGCEVKVSFAEIYHSIPIFQVEQFAFDANFRERLDGKLKWVVRERCRLD